MKLSELATGQRGVIVKIMGHGGFRKRIVEMGFVKGKVVDVLLNAPFQDPVKYKIMGYEVSLRRSEAEMIEIVSEEEAKKMGHADGVPCTPLLHETPQDDEHDTAEEQADLTEGQLREAAMRKRRTINVALVGNPNCGKTSLFNFASGAHERVGNYSGVTVDAKEGHATFEGYEFNIVDLPGTYSLSTYSPEELYVRKQIIDNTPDVVINVIDSSNLERNLYLTTQLIDMHLRMVCALNMFDETEKRGDHIDCNKLGQLFGVPMVPTAFNTGRGVDTLFHIIINIYEGLDFVDHDGNLDPEVADGIRKWHDQYSGAGESKDHDEDFASGIRPKNNVSRHIHINHGKYIEEGIAQIQQEIKKREGIRHKYSTRYLAIKLLEKDAETERLMHDIVTEPDSIFSARDRAAENIRRHLHDDSENAIMDAKYGFIHGALHESGYQTGNDNDIYQATHIIDNVITNRYVGFPLFLVVIWLMFEATFSLGQYPMMAIEYGVEQLSALVSATMPHGPLKDMLVEGVIGGVGSVIVFLPQILILYLFISLMEDSGYMARAAFIMDKLMHKIGLHGKSFIPLVMGFGCNVPALLATRTIESRRSQLITILILPMMSCSARFPIYIMITGAMFAPSYGSTVMFSLYVLGVLMAAVSARMFSKFLFKGEDTPFVMELPPYRMPTGKALFRHTWQKGKEYLKKMGGVILVASIIVWALGYFPHNDSLSPAAQREQSYIGRIGKAVEPVFQAQGFSWKLDVGIISGIGAKEIVASTVNILYNENDAAAHGNDEEVASSHDTLATSMAADGITPLTAYCFMVFVLLYFPCIATIATIKNETGSWRWAAFAALYTTTLAWVVSAAVRHIGVMLGF